jgi:NADPH:quinone reductase-like Zn-dependent oxidoreductase
MKAIVYKEFGPPDVLRLEEIPKPTPSDDEVMVKIHSASVNYGDYAFLIGEPFFLRLMGAGLLKPSHRILGLDMAGEVEAFGKNIKQFQPGDEVFGESGFSAFAEYRCVTEDKLVLKPANISFDEAAAVPESAVTALQGLRDKGQIRSGQKVLINGASGGVGTFAVQIAKSFGAEVTGVCSTGKLDMVHSIGADHVIDYTEEDFTKSGQRYDLILAANGSRPILEHRRALGPEGIYVATGPTAQLFQAMFLGPFMSMTGSKKMGSSARTANKEDLVVMKELLEAGKVVPVIDKRYPLSEVPEALRYIGEGHALGKVVITVAQNGK